MKILFIHQNFPGQFVHLAPALAKQGHEVHALVLHCLSDGVDTQLLGEQENPP